jgi:hypothetical protein
MDVEKARTVAPEYHGIPIANAQKPTLDWKAAVRG